MVKFKLLLTIGLFLALNFNGKSQCAANFTYANVGGGTINFTSTSIGTNSLTTYNWDYDVFSTYSVVGNGTSATTFPINGIFNVTLTIFDPVAPCTSSIALSLTVTNAPCIGNTSFIYNLAQNGVTSFYNTTSGLPLSVNWLWSFGDGGTSNLYSPIHTYSSSGVYTVTLLATDIFSLCTYSNTQTVNIVVGTCSLNSSFSYTSAGATFSFNSTSTGTSGTTNYFWDFDDGNTSSFINPVNSYTSNGIYNVTLIITDSVNFFCSSTTTQVINFNSPCIANVNFTMSKDSTAIPAIVWNVFPNYPGNILNADWSWGDGSNTIGLYPSHTYSTTGMYNICVTVTVTCGSTASTCSTYSVYKTSTPQQVDNSMAVVHVKSGATAIPKKSLDQINLISIFPNPNSGEFFIKGDILETNKRIEIKIFDVLGREVFTREEDVSRAKINTEIKLNDLNNGTYFIKIFSGERVYIKKVIISD